MPNNNNNNAPDTVLVIYADVCSSQ